MLQPNDSAYLNLLRGASVIRVMLVHLGLSWLYPPWSYYIGIFLPILFFVSGAVSFHNYMKKPFGNYLFKRITGLWIPFFLFTIPVVLVFSARNLRADPASLTSWLLLWPPQSLFPFPIGQIWFINTLLLIVILSAPIFPVLRRSPTAWFAAGLLSYFILTLSLDRVTIITLFRKLPIFETLRLPDQLHQAFVLIQFYFWGAFYYKNPVSRKFLTFLCIFTLLPGLYLSCLNSSNVERQLEGRSANYILLAHAAIFALLIGRDVILSLINHIVALKSLLLFANRNSYALFLLHTPVLFLIERYLGLENLSGSLHLAIVRLLLVVVITMLLSVPFTSLSRLISKYVSKLWPKAAPIG